MMVASDMQTSALKALSVKTPGLVLEEGVTRRFGFALVAVYGATPSNTTKLAVPVPHCVESAAVNENSLGTGVMFCDCAKALIVNTVSAYTPVATSITRRTPSCVGTLAGTSSIARTEPVWSEVTVIACEAWPVTGLRSEKLPRSTSMRNWRLPASAPLKVACIWIADSPPAQAWAAAAAAPVARIDDTRIVRDDRHEVGVDDRGHRKDAWVARGDRVGLAAALEAERERDPGVESDVLAGGADRDRTALVRAGTGAAATTGGEQEAPENDKKGGEGAAQRVEFHDLFPFNPGPRGWLFQKS